MFIKFTLKDGTIVAVNPQQIVSIEAPKPLAGIQGGQPSIRIHCLEGRVFSLDPKDVSLESLLEQLEIKEIETNVGRDQGSPVR